MALAIKSGSRRSSSLGALFVSNPKRKKPVRRKNVAKKRKARKTPARKRKTTTRKRKPAAKRLVVRLNPMRMKSRKNAAHKRKNAAHKRKKNALAIKRRKNALALKRRKNGTKKGQIRKTSRRAYMKRRKNPAHKRKNAAHKSKRVVRRIIRNPSMEIAALKPVKKFANKIPLIKKVTPYLGASVMGMAVVVPFTYGYSKISAYIQDSAAVPQFVKTTEKYAGIALTGMGLAVLSNYLLGMSKLVSKQTAKNSAIAIAILSGGAQFLRLKEMYEAGEIKIPFLKKKSAADITVAADGSVQGLAFLGDGMAYDVVPMAGMHANPHCMNGAHMSGAHMGGMHLYGDASAQDATQCPYDLDAKEKAMALRGAAAYMRAFGPVSHRASSHDGCSKYAGKHGHRWGWLIKVLGWDRFAKLCKMSAPDRIRAISQLKIACINAAQKSFDSSGYSGLALDMGGLAYSQDSYSGLAMVGSAH